MADDLDVTPGIGAKDAADLIGGVFHKRVKVQFGVDGVATDVSATDPMPVTGTIATSTSSSTNPVAVTVSAVVSATPKAYRGFSLRETAGAAATVVLYDNATTNSGTIIEEIALNPGESAREYYGAGGGITTANGIYCQVTGTVAGSVRTA